MMRRWRQGAFRGPILRLAAAFACLASSAAGVEVPTEAIVSFHSEIRVNSDSSLDVEETIRVRSLGQQIRHGIYRDFPTTYRTASGTRVVVDFTLLGARRDGRPEEARIEPLENGKRIYLGSRSVTLTPREYTYTIVYRATRQIGYFENHDELYWNVTGNGWSFPIEVATARVVLPRAITGDSVRVTGYTGPQGSTGQDLVASVYPSGAATFQAGSALPAASGLTIVVSWPKGFVHEPTRIERIGLFVADNPGLTLGLGGLLLVLVYYGSVWLLVGRDPDGGPIVVAYEPPDGLSPAETRHLVRQKFDDKVFATALLDMAVRGILTIDREGGTYRLRKTERVVTMRPEENEVVAKLFAGAEGAPIELVNRNHVPIEAARSKLRRALASAHEPKLYSRNLGPLAIGVVLSIAVVGGVFYLGGEVPDASFALYGAFASIAAGITATIFPRWRKQSASVFMTLTLGAASLVTGLIAWRFVRIDPPLASSLILFIAVNSLFARWLPAPTVAGRKLLDAVEGFRRFLDAVEQDRMDRMLPPEKTPELFEKYLPYALALDLEHRWAQQFSAVLVPRAGEGQTYAPAWYDGRDWTSLGAGGFAGSLGSGLSSAIAASSTPPGTSSGFSSDSGSSGGEGGGGSSGGGGGGGGGGGW